MEIKIADRSYSAVKSARLSLRARNVWIVSGDSQFLTDRLVHGRTDSSLACYRGVDGPPDGGARPQCRTADVKQRVIGLIDFFGIGAQTTDSLFKVFSGAVGSVRYGAKWNHRHAALQPVGVQQTLPSVYLANSSGLTFVAVLCALRFGVGREYARRPRRCAAWLTVVAPESSMGGLRHPPCRGYLRADCTGILSAAANCVVPSREVQS